MLLRSPIFRLVILFFSVSFFVACRSIKQISPTQNSVSILDLKTRADLAIQQEFERTVDPETGTVPRERLWLAYEEMQNRMPGGKLHKAALSGITWQERGPSNVGGRTRAIIFDLNDASRKTVFAASVSGGLWKTTNIYATNVQWTSVNDQFDNMAITSIAQDPVHPDTIYFGTGEGFYNSDYVRGDGVWKSTDGGANFTQLSSTTGLGFDYINKVIVDNNHNVLIATRAHSGSSGGVYRSTNQGTSWTLVENGVGSGSVYRASDVEMASNTTFYSSFGIFYADGIYKSTDSGSTWSRVYTAASDEYRIEIACLEGYPNTVYALLQKSDYSVKKMIKTVDGGSNWITLANVSWEDQCSGSPVSDFTRGQAWYDLIAIIDPNDTATVFIGGIDLFKTTNGGTGWTQISAWPDGGCDGYPGVHADQHAMVFKPGSSDTILFGNDGGIYLSKNATSSTPAISAKETNYNTTQFYACAIHPTAQQSYFLAGAQDNGSQQFSAAGINSTTEVTGGDGAYTHIDQDNPTYQFTSYVYNQYRKSTDGGTTFSNVNFSSTEGNFINATDYDNDAFILYAAYTAGYYLRWTNPRTGSSASTVNVGWSGKATAVTCDPNTANRVYFGTSEGKVYRVNSAHGGSPSATNLSTGLPSGTVSCIAIEKGDTNHLLVTFSNYGTNSVYESTNGGTSWTNVEGDLPDMPVRWVMFSPHGGDSALLATELGVWSTNDLNGSSTSWGPSNTGFPHVRTDMLQFRESDSLILAATHGRGLFTTKYFSARVDPEFGADKTVAYVGEAINFFDDSYGATSWEWDIDNDGIYDLTSQNPTFAYGEGGFYSVKLRINGSSGPTETKTNYIQIIPRQGTPYTTGDGGDMESNAWHFGCIQNTGSGNKFERGAPSQYFTTSHYNGSNAWVTDLDAIVSESTTETVLYSPSFNFTASGTYTLSFVRAMEAHFSNAPYAAVVEYSIDAGETWNLLGLDNTGTNWYNKGANSASIIHTAIRADSTGFLGTLSKATASHTVSSLAGNSDVRFRIVFNVSNGFSSIGYKAGFLVDDFAVAGESNDSIGGGGGIETTTSSRTIALGADDSSHFYSSDGKIIATIWNEDGSHDFGSTLVEIDNAGGSTSDFSTNTAANAKIFSKTLKITPTTSSGTADVKISMYFTAEELSAWKTATGLAAKDIQLFKTTNAIASSTIAQGVYPSATTVDSTYQGSNLCVTGSFTNGFSGVGAGGGGAGIGGPLPVTWLNIDLKRDPNTAIISWSTASEVNNEKFEIQRISSNTTSEVIGYVNGSGTTSSTSHYIFTDMDPMAMLEPVLCYKVVQIDYDGQRDASKTICADKKAIPVALEVRPNPARDFIQINVTPIRLEKYFLEIINVNGEVVMGDLSVQNDAKVKIDRLIPGIYFVRLISPKGEIQTTRFSKY